VELIKKNEKRPKNVKNIYKIIMIGESGCGKTSLLM
jgi:GTPase SAR1 family protein